ncbi:MAG: hypothetical protein CW691_00440 [Candidatus Bathyarchaeum sp.]|nr:MAG: hypothetical protein CW691_00440 [Candidatus Bathyarchaeum sp.]
MNAYYNSKKNVHDNARNIFENIWLRLKSFFCFLKESYKTLILVAIVAIASVGITSCVSIMLSDPEYNVYVPSLAVIKTIEVELYNSSNGENRLETLSWDELEPGKSINTSFYIKSVSNFIVTLNFHLTDWDPIEISGYLTISWDYNNTRIEPGEIIPVTMTLSASSSDDFIDYLVENEITRFDVVIHFIASN